MIHGRKPRRTYDIMHEINVTPFVDVVLVLLIIFMITAPLMIQGLDIKLPRTETQALAKKENWVISIFRNGEIRFNNKPIKLGELEKRLEQLAGTNPAMEVLLKADASLTYGYVVEVMAATRRAGVTNMGMITEPVLLNK